MRYWKKKQTKKVEGRSADKEVSSKRIQRVRVKSEGRTEAIGEIWR